MGVMRLGFMHVRVTNMDEAKYHYGEIIGLNQVAEVDGKVYYKGWDEWDHHSLVLEEGGVGVVKSGFKVRYEDDLAAIETAAQKFGVTTERFSKGENLETGEGLRCFIPMGHTIELYHDMTYLGSDVGTLNPEIRPKHLKAIGAPFLDHALIRGEDVAAGERFFIDVLGFTATERMVGSLDDDAPLVATWMSVSNKTHDFALLTGEDGGLHHFTWMLRDWNAVQNAADQFVIEQVPIDIGPTRHGITRGETIYFWDPAGNRNEVFAGGYNYMPDRPTITWTMDHLARGVNYYAEEVRDTFLNVST